MYTCCHTLALHDALPVWRIMFGAHHPHASDLGLGHLPKNNAAGDLLLGQVHEHRLVAALVVDRLQGVARRFDVLERALRSDEHTSELQSLLRLSYAVLCLKINSQSGQTTVRNAPR